MIFARTVVQYCIKERQFSSGYTVEKKQNLILVARSKPGQTVLCMLLWPFHMSQPFGNSPFYSKFEPPSLFFSLAVSEIMGL
uniref:Uncharacterized protein n=1 Tax=Anguilla anguilla TaxID=7936 RepID=A0A0E9X623_ANGAN